MQTQLNDTVQYHLPIGDDLVDMNALIGKEICFNYQGEINCVACGRKTKKSFSQGFCYPCFQSLAQCDMCIMKPEKCHYDEGTCREPEWGEQFCFKDHYVYLANSSGLKVGITRGTQIPTRWMDQGATQAMPIFKVKNRLTSGLVEVIFKNHVADKTSWQKMLKGEADKVDMQARRDELYALSKNALDELSDTLDNDSIEFLDKESVIDIKFPVNKYPEKVKSFNFDKTPEINGVLNGIKGQYLILENGVLNMRKFGGYNLTLEV
ncbi:MAG: DUF2797 domain-containing protein [endosymbiont of Galathealinum brachiosum]|uniref:DUF2797 domain-containing protein n=1 Tax=endosymbiont of Galathealinum brachiosum TaxID=2200906 RepID=A0A370DE92_9GAMM|nr:MAG: DUF2797 domain-containing protein [endosymbiont of Galathealinum brachiosum]